MRQACMLPGLCLLILLVADTVRGVGFTTTLDRNVVPVGETVTLNLIFEGATPNSAPSLSELQLPNLQLVPGGISQSSQITFVNGQQTIQATFSYTLQALQPGDVTIPALQFSVNGQTLSSHQLSLKIVPAGTAPAAVNNSPTNLAFVRLIVPKTEVFVGEPFPLEIHLYWQQAKDVHMPQLRAEGFTLSQIPQPGQSRTQVGNSIYELAVFKQVATAARSGALTLGPVEESLRILVPVNNPRRTRDPFDFFGFGPRYQEFPTTLNSETVAMRVLPLPAQGVPASFNGAIGNYQLAVTAGPTNVAVGDPITLHIQIRGRGPLDAISLPPQPQWRDFTSYPPTSKLETSDDFGLVGSKSFEQVLIPQNHEITVLPPVEFSFFDPAAKSYRSLTGPSIPLTVRTGGLANAPPPLLTNSAGATAPPLDDIIHIKPHLDLTASAAPLLVGRPWFVALQVVPALLWLSLLVWRRRTDLLANNPRLRRRREVAQRVRDGLKELRLQADGRRPEEFFATLFRLLQEQLGERLDLPASAITEAVIDQRLRTHSLRDDTLQSLRDLFQTCNVARYAPMQAGQELAALVPKLETVLRDLQRLNA